jgi:hypothetical protein
MCTQNHVKNLFLKRIRLQAYRIHMRHEIYDGNPHKVAEYVHLILK